MTDFEKLKSDMEEWMRQLGIEPPVGIHDYVPLIMNRVALDEREVSWQRKAEQEELSSLKKDIVNLHGILRRVVWRFRGAADIASSIECELAKE